MSATIAGHSECLVRICMQDLHLVLFFRNLQAFGLWKQFEVELINDLRRLLRVGTCRGDGNRFDKLYSISS